MQHETEVPGWAVERGRHLNEFDAIHPATTALVVVDMQNVFMNEEEAYGNPYAIGVLPQVNRLASCLREAGGTVIWTRQTVSQEAPLAMPHWQYDLRIPEVRHAVETMGPGTRSQALHAETQPAEGDPIIDKYRYNAFVCPARGLERTLEGSPIEMLIFVGTLTNICIESTARDANMLGYKVIVVSDACAAKTDAEHNAALLNLRIGFADVKDTATICDLLA